MSIVSLVPPVVGVPFAHMMFLGSYISTVDVSQEIESTIAKIQEVLRADRESKSEVSELACNLRDMTSQDSHPALHSVAILIKGLSSVEVESGDKVDVKRQIEDVSTALDVWSSSDAKSLHVPALYESAWAAHFCMAGAVFAFANGATMEGASFAFASFAGLHAHAEANEDLMASCEPFMTLPWLDMIMRAVVVLAGEPSGLMHAVSMAQQLTASFQHLKEVSPSMKRVTAGVLVSVRRFSDAVPFSGSFSLRSAVAGLNATILALLKESEDNIKTAQAECVEYAMFAAEHEKKEREKKAEEDAKEGNEEGDVELAAAKASDEDEPCMKKKNSISSKITVLDDEE